MRVIQASLSIVGLLFLAACSSQPDTSSVQPNTDSNAQTTEAPTETAAKEEDDSTQAMLNDLVLVNANTGESFTLADFQGKTVSIEVMSVTCSSCQKQHKNTVQAYQQLKDSDEYVFVSLSIDAGLPDAELKQFAESEGYSWIFAVATPDMTRALDAQFGQAAFSTANTPQFTVLSDGSISDLSTGFKEPEVLVSHLETASAQ
ncbi:MAG: redoxin family protein [Cyanobacteria bacterium SID2]|nr:redoxin family protein [Cyanobacteria bacterium SID2]MBP0003240.1 redoxin family protein [Cyanobacteria bacterium SBC]